MRATYEELKKTLEQFLPVTTSRIVLRTCLEGLKLEAGKLDAHQVATVAEALVPACRHFVKDHDRERLRVALKRFASSAPQVAPLTVALEQESDLSAARLNAKLLTEQLGGSSLQSQKAATAVSELARNIIVYARRGVVQLLPDRGPPARLKVIASDDGPGIAHLDLVLSGRYRSKTGMGLGLLGVKRLADRFDVKTGPGGTRVEFELLV